MSCNKHSSYSTSCTTAAPDSQLEPCIIDAQCYFCFTPPSLNHTPVPPHCCRHLLFSKYCMPSWESVSHNAISNTESLYRLLCCSYTITAKHSTSVNGFTAMLWPDFYVYVCRRWSLTRWTVSQSLAIWYTTSSNSTWVSWPFGNVLSSLWPTQERRFVIHTLECITSPLLFPEDKISQKKNFIWSKGLDVIINVS